MSRNSQLTPVDRHREGSHNVDTHMSLRRKIQGILAQFITVAVLCAISGYASAELVDDIVLKKDSTNNEIDAHIKFNVPIQYVRHFPLQKSSYLTINFNSLDNSARDQWIDYETHRSPPSDIIYSFTVTTRDLREGPKVEIQFIHTAEYSVSAGTDNRSLIVHIKPIQLPTPVVTTVAPSSVPTSSPVIVTVVSPLPAISPVVAKNSSPVAAVTTVATPAPVPTLNAAAPSTSTTVVAQPKIAPPQPSAAATVQSRPAEIQPVPALKPAPTPRLRKDDLPPFPEIEQPAPMTGNAPPSGSLSLAEQIQQENNKAAVLMLKARNALFSGEIFVAIDALNNVLKLAPNKYSQDAQIWIGIAREKSGQQAKAKLEYESYLKLYPAGPAATWAKERLAKLNAAQQGQAMQQTSQPQASDSNFQTSEYGSFSLYYYRGASNTDTVTSDGTTQTPSSISLTDQSSLISNISMTARAYNNEYDNRLVFQDFYSKNFLTGQDSKNRLNAAFFEIKNRTENYSARIGRQSALGGGVLGRFDGISAGYGFLSDLRANVVAGQLSDTVLGPQPVFLGTSLDFGVRSPLGGSLYAIKQTVGGMTDREAAGGYLRYFEQSKTAVIMLDYDLQFKEINMLTVQGSYNSESGTGYNFLWDRRKTPSLSMRNAVNGTTASLDTLRQNGWTTDDLLSLAQLRTAVSNMAQIGMTNRIKDNWQIGTDITVTNTSGMPASGTLNPDGTVGLEGFVAASASTGNAWTISERLIGNSVFSDSDVSMCSVSYSKSDFMQGKTLLLNSHSYLLEKWTIDETLRLYWQTDSTGGNQTISAPVVRLGYRLKKNLMLETEAGVDLSKSTPNALQSSNTTRTYFSFGFRQDF